MKNLTMQDLYRELDIYPDLRRLGKYRVVAGAGKAIFAIDVNLPNSEVHLGDGDFREAFVALAETKVKSLDFGSCVFTDLYLDYLVAESVSFSNSKASRLYFDFTQIGECHFGNFSAPEVFFDSAKIKNIHSEQLRAGNVFPENLECASFDPASMEPNTYRITTGVDPTKLANKGPGTTSDETEIKEFTAEEFKRLLSEGLDLTRLGRYRIIPNGEDNLLVIHYDLGGRDLNFGRGDFRGMKVSFGSTIVRTIDFSNSKFGEVDFQSARVESLFFGDFEGENVHFDTAKVDTVYWERGKAKSVHLDELSCGQFNINSLVTEELRMGRARVGGMFLSVGAGVKKMFFEQSQVTLLNLHEGKLEEVDFGNSTVERAMVNKSSIGVIRCAGLKSKLLYFGNFKNEIGKLIVGDNTGIKHIELGDITPISKENWTVGEIVGSRGEIGEDGKLIGDMPPRDVLKEMKLGPSIPEESQEHQYIGPSYK